VDDFSGMAFVYFLKTKDEIFDISRFQDGKSEKLPNKDSQVR